MFDQKPLSAEEAKQMNPVTLAFLGDAVYSLYVRDRMVRKGGRPAEFQRAASKVVSAHGQSTFLERLLPLFTQEEEEIYRRGRNAKKATKSKNATAAEYNRSTGFEAVLGYLYITENNERLHFLLWQTEEESLQGQAAQRAFKP